MSALVSMSRPPTRGGSVEGAPRVGAEESAARPDPSFGGSDFRPEGAFGSFNFIEPYLRGIFGFIGITEVEFIYAHSLNDGNPLRESSLAAAGESVLALASA